MSACPEIIYRPSSEVASYYCNIAAMIRALSMFCIIATPLKESSNRFLNSGFVYISLGMLFAIGEFIEMIWFDKKYVLKAYNLNTQRHTMLPDEAEELRTAPSTPQLSIPPGKRGTDDDESAPMLAVTPHAENYHSVDGGQSDQKDEEEYTFLCGLKKTSLIHGKDYFFAIITPLRHFIERIFTIAAALSLMEKLKSYTKPKRLIFPSIHFITTYYVVYFVLVVLAYVGTNDIASVIFDEPELTPVEDDTDARPTSSSGVEKNKCCSRFSSLIQTWISITGGIDHALLFTLPFPMLLDELFDFSGLLNEIDLKKAFVIFVISCISTFIFFFSFMSTLLYEALISRNFIAKWTNQPIKDKHDNIISRHAPTAAKVVGSIFFKATPFIGTAPEVVFPIAKFLSTTFDFYQKNPARSLFICFFVLISYFAVFVDYYARSIHCIKHMEPPEGKTMLTSTA